MTSERNPPYQTNSRSKPIYLAIFILALAGFISVMLATRWGVGASPDSVVYILGARHLAAGQDFSTYAENGELQAITHHAPFYSVMLAWLSALGLEPLQGARWLNALLFAGNILLVGFMLLDLLPDQAGGGRWAPVMGAGLVLFPAFLVEIHSMAWSESLFIFLSLAGLWTLSRAIKDQSYLYLVLSAIWIALALLTRYIGVVLVATGGLSIWLFSSRPFRRRVLDSLLFGLISAGPLALWLLRNSLSAGTATSRELLFHPIDRQQVGMALTTLGSWFLIPDSVSGFVKALPYLVLGLVLALCVLAWCRRQRRETGEAGWSTLSALPMLIRIILIFIPLYALFLIMSLTFLDANTPLDSRIFSPVYVTGVILVVYFLAEGLSGLGKVAIVRYALIAGCLGFLAALTLSFIPYVQNAHRDGIGFTSRGWRQSPTLAALGKYPAQQVVYTNGPEAFYLYTDRIVRLMPKKYESANQRPNEAYETELMTLKEQVLTEGAIIVYFDHVMRNTLPGAQEISDLLGLRVLERTADGVIYGIKGQNPVGIVLKSYDNH
jgi:hypothetical protein